VHNGQNFDCGRRNPVGDNIRNVCQGEFVRTLDTAGSAHGRINREMIGGGDDAGMTRLAAFGLSRSI
jgi:hypothetical protein